MNECLDVKHYIMGTVHHVKHHNNLLSLYKSLSSFYTGVLWRATSRGFVMGKEDKAAPQEMKCYGESLCTSCRSYKQKLREKCFLKEKMSCTFCLLSPPRLTSAPSSKNRGSLESLWEINPLSLKNSLKNKEPTKCQTKIISMCNRTNLIQPNLRLQADGTLNNNRAGLRVRAPARRGLKYLSILMMRSEARFI